MNIKQLPNILTFLNLICGVISIVFLFEGKYFLSALLILVSAFFDLIDGKIAQKPGAMTQFGKQLDSFSDLISFGIAPSVLIFYVGFQNFEIWGLALTIVYVLCGTYRLVRFNLEESNTHFVGMPIPVSGVILALVILFRDYIPAYVYPLLMILCSVLMVCSFKTPIFKNKKTK